MPYHREVSLDAPSTIHEQPGLRIWKNARNGFTIARLHFTADPRKRTPEWIAESKRGMSPAQWEQEFNISYNAFQGERAFPEIVTRRDEIVSKEGPYVDGLWPLDLPMWGGFDYGARNPSSFHVYTVVDGITYALWEMYGPCRNLISYAEEMKACPYWSQIRYIIHDPDMCNYKQRDMKSGDVSTVRSQFESLGITKLVKGNTDTTGWISTMRKHWCGKDITFRILETCPAMIHEFEHATYVTMTERQLETQNYKEALVDKQNHTLDDCKYFMNSGAASTRPRPAKSPTPLVAAYGWGGGSTPVRTDRYKEHGF